MQHNRGIVGESHKGMLFCEFSNTAQDVVDAVLVKHISTCAATMSERFQTVFLLAEVGNRYNGVDVVRQCERAMVLGRALVHVDVRSYRWRGLVMRILTIRLLLAGLCALVFSKTCTAEIVADTLSYRDSSFFMSNVTAVVGTRFTTAADGSLSLTQVVIPMQRGSGEPMSVGLRIAGDEGTLYQSEAQDVTNEAWTDVLFESSPLTLDANTAYWACVVWIGGGTGYVGRSTGGHVLDDPWLQPDDDVSFQWEFGSSDTSYPGEIVTLQMTAVPEPSMLSVLVLAVFVSRRVGHRQA